MKDCWSENMGEGWVKHFDYGLVTYTRNGEEYVPCKECGTLFPEEFADNQDDLCGECFDRKNSCHWCGEEHLENPKQTKDGPLCDKCYTEYLEDENKRLKQTLSYVLDFIKQEATVLEAAMSDFAAAPRDPENIGRMVGKTQAEVNVMKGYPERMAV